MEHDSGQPEDLAASGDAPSGDGGGRAGGPGAGQGTAGQERADEKAGGTEVTGVAQVDEAIAGLVGLPGRPVAEHVAVFEEAHAKLRQVLSDLDDGPADS